MINFMHFWAIIKHAICENCARKLVDTRRKEGNEVMFENQINYVIPKYWLLHYIMYRYIFQVVFIQFADPFDGPFVMK